MEINATSQEIHFIFNSGIYLCSGQTHYPAVLTMSYVLPTHLHIWKELMSNLS